MDSALLIDHGSGVARSVSEIPLVRSISRRPSSLSSATSSPAREPAAASNPSGGGNGNAGLGNTRPVGTTRLSATPRPRPQIPPATAAPISTEDVSKVDLGIMACSITIVVAMALNIQELTSSWQIPLKDLYGVLMILSLASTVTGFFTALCPAPAVPWGKRLSSTFAMFGLVDAVGLLIIFIACKLGRQGWAVVVASAALIMLILAVVWAWSDKRQPATGGADEATAMLVPQGGAGDGLACEEP